MDLKERPKEDIIAELIDLKEKYKSLENRYLNDIQSFKTSEIALHNSEQKYAKAFLTSPYAITITNAEDGKFIEVNNAFTMMTGYTYQEAISDSSIGLNLWANIEHRNFVISELNQDRKVSGREFVFIKKNQEPITCLFSAEIVMLDNKPFILSSINDITASKNYEKRLQKNEALYQSILLASPDNITITDLKGMVSFASSKALSMFAYESLDDLMGRNIAEFLVPEDRQRAEFAVSNMFEGVFSGPADYRAIKADGSIIDIEVNAEFIKDAEGFPVNMVFIIRDITSRKVAERLRNQQLLFTQALNKIAEIIISKSDAAEILDNTNRLLGETLELDRTLIYEVSLPENKVKGLCEWISVKHQEIERIITDYPLALFETPFKELQSTKSIIESHFNTINKCFLGNGLDNYLHNELKIKSLIWFPFNFSAEGCFVFTLNQIINSRKFSQQEVVFVESVANLVSLALIKIRLLQDSENAQINLSRSEERFRQLVEQSPLSIVITDLNGTTEYANSKAAEITGYSVNELIGTNLRILKSGDTDKNEYISLWDTISKGQSWTGIFHNKKKNNELYWESATISPMLNLNNEITHYIAFKEDITDRKIAEDQVRSSEEKYRSIFETVQDAYYEAFIDGTILEISPSINTISRGQFTRDELIGKSLVDFYENPDERTSFFSELSKSGKVIDYELTLKNKDNSVISVSISSTLIFDENGKPYKITGSLRDISERKAVENELRKFRTISDQANYGNAIAELDGTIIYVNDSFAQMHGWEKADMIGRNLSIAHNEEQMDRVLELLTIMKTNGRFSAKELWHVRKDGSVFPTLMSSAVIYDSNKKPLFLSATTIDITNLKKSEQEIKHREEDLIYAQEIAKMGSWQLDFESNILKGSANYYKMLGLNPEDESKDLYQHFLSLVHKEDYYLVRYLQESE